LQPLPDYSKDAEDEPGVMDEDGGAIGLDGEFANEDEGIWDEYGGIEPVFSLDTAEDVGLDMY
ncbi:hypothetical protein PHLCEN_2v13333, partial [Hermanssonia centrifuga]